MIRNQTPCWMNGELVSFEGYLERAGQARDKADALFLTRTWIAREIGRSRGHTTRVLNGVDRGVETLLLIEDLLRRVERGEVAPR